jgi:hypothetical protein
MNRTGWIATIAGLLFALGLLGWALYATWNLGSWTGGSWVILAMIAFGTLGTGALAAGFMWLAFYSARQGYDDRAGFGDDDDHHPG